MQDSNMKKDLLFIFLLTFAGPTLMVYFLMSISRQLVILAMLIYGPILWYIFYGIKKANGKVNGG